MNGKRNDPLASYRGLWRSIKIYYNAYGGFLAFLRSPYWMLGLFVTLVGYRYWFYSTKPIWYTIVIDIVPSLLGFTLGGYAILLAVGSDEFREFISGTRKKGTPSAFMTINATFVHFILLQVVSLLLAIIGSGLKVKTGVYPFIGFFIFCYALMTSIAAAFALLRLAKIFDRFIEQKREKSLIKKRPKISRMKLLNKKRIRRFVKM